MLVNADARLCRQCETSLAGKRPHAIYCSRRCKTSASDVRRKDGRANIRDTARYSHEGDHRRDYAREQGLQMRREVLSHYGKCCAACSDTELLELDHVYGNGEQHRDQVGHGDAFFRYLKRENYPAECGPGGEYELQVLCRGCHVKKTKLDREGR